MYKLKEGNKIKRVYEKNKTVAEVEYLKNNIKIKNAKKKTLKYNLNKQGNKKLSNNKCMIRKNILSMSNEEVIYIKNNIKSMNINNLSCTFHALEKGLLDAEEIKNIIKSKNYKIIDFNYFYDNKEERYLIRTKKTYDILNEDGKIYKRYIKIVLSPIENKVVTVWSNKVEDEKHKNENTKTKYYNNFDIIEKKLKIG